MNAMTETRPNEPLIERTVDDKLNRLALEEA